MRATGNGYTDSTKKYESSNEEISDQSIFQELEDALGVGEEPRHPRDRSDTSDTDQFLSMLGRANGQSGFGDHRLQWRNAQYFGQARTESRSDFLTKTKYAHLFKRSLPRDIKF